MFYVLLRDCVIRDSLLSTDPALMEWFRRGVANTQKCRRLMRRGFVDVTVCNIFAKTQNKEIKVDFFVVVVVVASVDMVLIFMAFKHSWSVGALRHTGVFNSYR